MTHFGHFEHALKTVIWLFKYVYTYTVNTHIYTHTYKSFRGEGDVWPNMKLFSTGLTSRRLRKCARRANGLINNVPLSLTALSSSLWCRTLTSPFPCAVSLLMAPQTERLPRSCSEFIRPWTLIYRNNKKPSPPPGMRNALYCPIYICSIMSSLSITYIQIYIYRYMQYLDNLDKECLCALKA